MQQLADAMTEGFEKMDRRFDLVDKRFEQMTTNFKWGLIAAMAFLSLLITGLKFIA